MDKNGCGSSGVWNIRSDVSLDDVFFQFITWIAFNQDYVMWRIIYLLAWIGLWNKLRIYRVPPNLVRWSCQGFGYIWRAFMLIWIIC